MTRDFVADFPTGFAVLDQEVVWTESNKKLPIGTIVQVLFDIGFGIYRVCPLEGKPHDCFNIPGCSLRKLNTKEKRDLQSHRWVTDIVRRNEGLERWAYYLKAKREGKRCPTCGRTA